MSIHDLGIVSVAAITMICYLIGVWCKATEKVKDKLIPAIMGVSGAALGVVAYATKMPEFEGFHILTAIAVGIASGLAATGVNQIFKQAAKDE